MPFFTRRSSNFRGDPLCREIAPSCKRIMLSHQILFSMQSNSCRRVTVLCWFFFFFKQLWIQKFVSIDCRGFFSGEIRPPILSLRFGVNTLVHKWKFVTQIPSMPSNNFKFKTVSDWREIIMFYEGLWTNQDGVRNDSVVKQKIKWSKKSSFVHFLSFDYQPFFGKWACTHRRTNSRKRRELILLTTHAKVVGYGAVRDGKPI